MLQTAAAGVTAEPQCLAPAMDVPVESLSTAEEVQAALDDPQVSKTRKQKLKQRLKQLQACHTHFSPNHAKAIHSHAIH